MGGHRVIVPGQIAEVKYRSIHRFPDNLPQQRVIRLNQPHFVSIAVLRKQFAASGDSRRLNVERPNLAFRFGLLAQIQRIITVPGRRIDYARRSG